MQPESAAGSGRPPAEAFVRRWEAAVGRCLVSPEAAGGRRLPPGATGGPLDDAWSRWRLLGVSAGGRRGPPNRRARQRSPDATERWRKMMGAVMMGIRVEWEW